MNGSVLVPAHRVRPGGQEAINRDIAIETPIAIEYNGIGYAVMMATPTDFEDFATGFSLCERIVSKPSEIEDIEAHQTPLGWLLKIQISQRCVDPMVERVRVRVSESSCGLCGLENLEQVMRPLPEITAKIEVGDSAIFAAIGALRDHQPLNAATGGVHAAAFCATDGRILIAREDVGRHTAFDKLIGALSRAGVSPSTGFFLLSSRCSYELVEKAVVAGCPLLVTLSTATSLAIERAKSGGLRLYALARPDAFLAVS